MLQVLRHKSGWWSGCLGELVCKYIATARCGLSFNKEAIWQKAIQHAREDGLLLNEAKDIGYLIGAVKKDFHEENGEAIKKKLIKEFYSDIERGVVKGFPEFYKAQLLEKALEEKP